VAAQQKPAAAFECPPFRRSWGRGAKEAESLFPIETQVVMMTEDRTAWLSGRIRTSASQNRNCQDSQLGAGGFEHTHLNEVRRATPHSQRKSQAMIDSSGSNSEMQKFESFRPSEPVLSLWDMSRSHKFPYLISDDAVPTGMGGRGVSAVGGGGSGRSRSGICLRAENTPLSWSAVGGCCGQCQPNRVRKSG
jgi:hypothetical protein